MYYIIEYVTDWYYLNTLELMYTTEAGSEKVPIASNSGGKRNPYQDHMDEAITLEEFLAYYGGMTHYEIVTEMNNTTRLQSSADGPVLRYMIDPHTGNVIDLMHMLIIGDTGGGFLVGITSGSYRFA